MLNKELEFTLNNAFKQAREKRHEFLTVEHLLLSLLDNTAAARALSACGAQLPTMRDNLMDYIERTTPLISTMDEEHETQPTLAFQRVLQRSIFHAQSSCKGEVTGANVLVAIFSEQESDAVRVLQEQHVTRLDITNYIAHGVRGVRTNEPDQLGSIVEDETCTENEIQSPLEKYAVNLNDKARSGKVDPLIGRTEELMRAMQVLCRRRKNNPLFVGEAGVGKTALVEGLASMIVNNNAPEKLANVTIYSLDLGSLLAGTKYRGDFEKRLKAVLQQLDSEKDAVMFIDEIHTLIGAGAASGGVMDASNLIKPMLANGELKCIGATTYQEYRAIFEKDHALTRRFQKIDVSEATVSETIAILEGLRPQLEKHHNIKYSDEALNVAPMLAERHINNRFLPDKAIDVVDEAGAMQNLLPIEQRKTVIGVKEIEDAVAKIARVPSQSVSSSEKDLMYSLDSNLKMMVYGQDKAIDSLASVIKLSRAGLGNPQKPIGAFMFTGPTGVGKTELARQLANVMGIELLRFDMSEYMEKHSVARLLGAPPGYVGYEEGGLLTDSVTKHPYSVVLLDEIEKAHPDIFNILLQVMDHGSLTDANGRKTDFRNVILILTSNSGAELLTRSSVGFLEQDNSGDNIQVVDRTFPPEFRNRLDGIISFKHLDTKVIANIVDKFILELEKQLEDKGITIKLDNGAKRWLVEHGYDKNLGARPMARLIQKTIKQPLADKLLFGELCDASGAVSVIVRNNKIALQVRCLENMATTH